MTEYLGRTVSCIAGTKYPDSNLASYAKEHGFETALLGVVFQGSAGNPRKIYSYWGHTGVKRNHYLKVMVPRGNGQEEVFVKVMSVLPATGIKENSRVTAKHMLQNTGARKITEGTPYIKAAPEEMIQRWRNEMCRDLLPMPKTEHAKSAINVIDGMLSDDLAMDFKADDRVDALARGNEVHRQMEKQLRLAEGYSFGPLPPAYYAILEHKPLEAVRKMFQQDFSALEPRVAAHEGRRFREYLRETWLERQLARHKLVTPKARPPKSVIGTFRPSQLPRLETCSGRITGQSLPSNLPKENTVSAKIENVTYVTLPNSTSRRDAKTLTAEEFFSAIGALEAEGRKLEAIQRKPRALQEKIEELDRQINDLSALCDSLHATKVEASAYQGEPKSQAPTYGATYPGDTDGQA